MNTNEKIPFMVINCEPVYEPLSAEDLSRVLVRLLDFAGVEVQTDFFKYLNDGEFDSCFYSDEAKGKVHDIVLKCFVEPYIRRDRAGDVAVTLIDGHWEMVDVPAEDLGEVNLNFLEDTIPRLSTIAESLEVLPDMCTESQRECLVEMAVALRRIAGRMDKAGKGGGERG